MFNCNKIQRTSQTYTVLRFSLLEQLQSTALNYSEDILADNALFKCAELYENQLSNTEKAKEYYSKILFDYPGSLFVVEARKRYRAIAGEDSPPIIIHKDEDNNIEKIELRE